MRVTGQDAIDALCEEHHQARKAFDKWLDKVEAAHWKKFLDVRGVFNHADACTGESGAGYVIFDVGGNKYRLVARVHYEIGQLDVIAAMTHKEYDTDRWKDGL